MPGQEHFGTTTDALVELVDIFPTLCDACELPDPFTVRRDLSMVPVIKDPMRPMEIRCLQSKLEKRMAHAVHLCGQINIDILSGGTNAWLGKELYDSPMPIQMKPSNIAHLPENAVLVAQLSEQLQAGWRAALPDVSEQTPVPQTLPWDINNDGIVDIRDMILIANSFGAETLANPKVDVNKDGSVDILDLILVAAHFGESSNSAASPRHANINGEHLDLVEQWLIEARLTNDGSAIFRQGIATLEALVDAVLPTETVLLPNYPNPFNPETWIPYDLAKNAEVYIHIYNLKGELIRELSPGFQTAGTYRTTSRAVYWDGRNAAGEPVASGVYFCTFQAGNVNATRQMVILK